MIGTIFSLAWPTMLEQLLQTTVSYLDTAMVGSLGTLATAAVGSTGTVNWLIMGMISAVSVGFLAYISQSIGAGDLEKAKKASAQSVFLTVIIGIIYTVAITAISPLIPVWMKADPAIRELAGRYCFITFSPLLFRTATIIFGTILRASGDTKTPMKVGLLVNFVNLVLNFLFIYPTRTIRIFSKDIRIFGTGWGVEGAAIASAISFVVGGVVITAALFRHPMISPRKMSLKPDKDILRYVFRIAFPNMIQRFGTSFGYVVFASMINALGATVLRMVALSEPFYGVPIVVEGIMQGLGKTKISLIFNISGMWCIRIAGTYICTKILGYGLVSAWACMIGHNVLLFFLFGILYMSGKWNPMEKKTSRTVKC